jgi:UDP-N-acetylglucosamine--N-acetylmuramyl-(pentapeptide) pyrophosphoryl-undecaprenol N-acetylglucosamine transferase
LGKSSIAKRLTCMSKTLLIMAAGTGGHIMPGLAVAEAMRMRGWDIHWLGTRHGMENRLVPARGVALSTINFSGLRGKGLLHTLTGVAKLILAIVSAWRLMANLRPKVILGMGGYVTVPGGWAARLRKIPLVLINADAALLMSNKALLPSAKRVLFGFDGERQLPDCAEKIKVTGNPVRAEIAALAAPEQRFAGRSGPLRLLVIGGSLGAQALNEILPMALALIPAEQRPIVTHQAGEKHASGLQAAYQVAGIQAEVKPFIDDMATAYAQADLLVCRAGAITLSELAVAGVPSILVPLVVSTTSHQQGNAQWMAEHGAAIYLPQAELTPELLAKILRELTRETLLGMAINARKLGKPDATQAIATELEEVALP